MGGKLWACNVSEPTVFHFSTSTKQSDAKIEKILTRLTWTMDKLTYFHYNKKLIAVTICQVLIWALSILTQ